MLNLKSLQLDLTDWTLHQEQAESAIYFDRENDVLSVNLFRAQPDIPVPGNGVAGLRNYFRQTASSQGCGIVEVDVVRIHNTDCARFIIKAPQKPTDFSNRFSYQGSLAIPKQSFSFVIRVQCLEGETTGLRDSLVMALENANIQTEPVEEYVEHPIFGRVLQTGKIIGWTKDPYDPQFDNTALFNLSDQQKYDAIFPNSPPSRARRKLTYIINTVKFDRDIIDAHDFTNSRSS